MQKCDEVHGLPGDDCSMSGETNGRPKPPTYEAVTPTTPYHRAFGRQGWALLLASLVLAIMWSAVFWPADLLWGYASNPWDLMLSVAEGGCQPTLVPGMVDWRLFGYALPGVGLTIVELAALACTLVAIGQRGRYDRTTVPLLAACVLMCLFPTLFGNHVLRVLNCLVLWVTGTYTLFLIADLCPSRWLNVSSHLCALRHFLVSLVRFVPLPVLEAFDLLKARRQSPETVATSRCVRDLALQVGIGLFVSLLLLNVVLPLLMSADVVFTTILSDAYERLFYLPELGELPVRILYALAVMPFLFSLMWGFSHSDPTSKDSEARGARRRWLHAVTAAVVLFALDLVYVLFVLVQFVYLFGGVESAAMSGGYAEYARSGFFQLVAVTFINVIVGLVVVRFVKPQETQPRAREAERPSLLVTSLVLMLVAMTYVILASACWRMGLYVSAYGLTILRCLTYLGMAFATVVLASLAVKTVRPSFPFYHVLVHCGVALWLAFNLANVDARIAEYNVGSYLNGTLEVLDVGYFWRLSPDAEPALWPLMKYVHSHDTDDLPATWPGVLGELEFFAGDEELVWLQEFGATASDRVPWQMQCLPYWKARNWTWETQE